jgi:hypothetical protein
MQSYFRRVFFIVILFYGVFAYSQHRQLPSIQTQQNQVNELDQFTNEATSNQNSMNTIRQNQVNELDQMSNSVVIPGSVQDLESRRGLNQAVIDARRAANGTDEVDSCDKAYSDAMSECKAGGTADHAASAIQTGVGGMAAARATDALAACKAGEMQALSAIGSSFGVGKMCQMQLQECSNSCKSETTNPNSMNKNAAREQARCETLMKSDKQRTVASVATGIAMFSQSISCKQALAAANGICPPTMNFEQCIQMCFSNGSMMPNPMCSASNCPPAAPGQSCGGMSNPYCQMLCEANNSGDMPGSGGLPNLGDSSGAFTENGQGFRGYKPGGNNQPVGSNDNASSGGGMPGGGAYPGGAGSQAAASNGANYNKDIDHGYSGGSGGGWSISSVPIEGGGGRGGNGENLDLSKYLPGGELDPAKRDIAAANDLRAQGITGANDLSNFEKVTRMMNKKRPLMKPGDGK